MFDCKAHTIPIPCGGALLIAARWLRFSAVGMAGVVVQLSALWFLARAGINYVLATALAVELALLHNFFWHEVWTWRGAALENRTQRLIRFHLANGLLSIGANTLLTWTFRQYWGLPLLMSNLAAISLASILNFAIAEFWVFRGESRKLQIYFSPLKSFPSSLPAHPPPPVHFRSLPRM